MNVKNMTSTKGNKVSNQFIITDDNKTYFQSYGSIIACEENGQITLDQTYWDYSRTTGKYRNMFLNENTATTRKKIADGTYKLADLNK